MILMQRTKSIVAASMSLGIAFLYFARSISGQPTIEAGTRRQDPESAFTDFHKLTSKYAREEHSPIGQSMRTEGVRLARQRPKNVTTLERARRFLI
jgi:hypothetical protein